MDFTIVIASVLIFAALLLVRDIIVTTKADRTAWRRHRMGLK